MPLGLRFRVSSRSDLPGGSGTCQTSASPGWSESRGGSAKAGSAASAAARAIAKSSRRTRRLPVELRTRRVIRPVDLRVTVETAAVHQAIVGGAAGRHVLRRQESRGVPEVRVVDRRVTLLTQERKRSDEQLLVIRAVRLVAVEAALRHGRVLPDEGPALLGVTAGAQLVHVVGLQQRLRGRAVRVVTVGAADLPLEQRHVRALREVGALLRVTGEAGLVRVLLAQE